MFGPGIGDGGVLIAIDDLPMPDKGWFMVLRLYSPLEPFFTKTWRPSEAELVR